jgi:hypothetical protein
MEELWGLIRRGQGNPMPPDCVESGHQPGAFSRPVAKIGRFFVSPLRPAVELAFGKCLRQNNLPNVYCWGTIGMDPAFEGARERAKERCIESVSSKRIPYVGIGG